MALVFGKRRGRRERKGRKRLARAAEAAGGGRRHVVYAQVAPPVGARVVFVVPGGEVAVSIGIVEGPGAAQQPIGPKDPALDVVADRRAGNRVPRPGLEREGRRVEAGYRRPAAVLAQDLDRDRRIRLAVPSGVDGAAVAGAGLVAEGVVPVVRDAEQ